MNDEKIHFLQTFFLLIPSKFMFQCNLEGIMGGGEMAAIVNQMIMDLAPTIFNEIKTPLVNAAVGKFVDLANSLLEGMTFQDLIDIIMGTKLLS